MTSFGRGVAGALWRSWSWRARVMTTGFGPFYDGLTHLLVPPEYLVPMIALALLAGLHGPRLRGAVPSRFRRHGSPERASASSSHRARRAAGDGAT
jgi:hypothetical protein